MSIVEGKDFELHHDGSFVGTRDSEYPKAGETPTRLRPRPSTNKIWRRSSGKPVEEVLGKFKKIIIAERTQ